MINYQQLLQEVQEHVHKYYKTHDTSGLIYHDLKHTEGVISAAIQIANHYQLNDHDFFIVTCACWFHDVGYITDEHNHEQKGAGMAAVFLQEHKADEKLIAAVEACIMATKMPQSATTLLEQIVCDADLFNLGTDEFSKKDKLMHQEFDARHHTNTSKQEWREKTIPFLESHQYYTEYCKLLLNDTQAKNLEKLKRKAGGKEEEETDEEEKHKDVLLKPVPEPGVKKKKKDRPDKGIETMFRISSSNHQRLSDMADKKAHILITVNSIILSAIISLVLRRLNEYGFLILPSFILLTVSVLAMTFAILSTRPSIPKGVFTKADVDAKKVNLLFFGNFYKMPLADFNYGMQAMMEDSDFLYGSLIKDLYSQGIVLGRKYKLLRVAYSIFMYGLILSVVAFIVASAFFDHKNQPFH